MNWPLRRFFTVLAGILSAAGAITLLILFATRVYYNLYIFPKMKEGYVLPLDWRNLFVIALICMCIFGLFLGAFKLLRSAARQN
jgi:uncharacterized membrane protein